MTWSLGEITTNGKSVPVVLTLQHRLLTFDILDSAACCQEIELGCLLACTMC